MLSLTCSVFVSLSRMLHSASKYAVRKANGEYGCAGRDNLFCL